MKLILKKNDSATSLLLFIFNNYMAKTSKDNIKLSVLLEIMQIFGKNESAVRMSLSRAVKAGLLTNSKIDNEIYYSLTPDGKKSIIYWNEGVTHFFGRYQFRNSPWDGKWDIFNIEFTEDVKDNKTVFIDKLLQLGFAQINTNTWITPYHQNEDIRKLINEYHLEDKIIEIHGEMKIHRDQEKFLDDIYGIERLRSGYCSFINTYSEKLPEIKQQLLAPDFVNNGLALPLLHSIGFSFFDTASEDPALPRQLLPEWEGDKAVEIMKELRDLLLQATYSYLEKFD
jgi:phenylacetic acid degradation operon negative regulatory protein